MEELERMLELFPEKECPNINSAFRKLHANLMFRSERATVSISGGADSDMMLDSPPRSCAHPLIGFAPVSGRTRRPLVLGERCHSNSDFLPILPGEDRGQRLKKRIGVEHALHHAAQTVCHRLIAFPPK